MAGFSRCCACTNAKANLRTIELYRSLFITPFVSIQNPANVATVKVHIMHRPYSTAIMNKLLRDLHVT